MQLKYNRQSGIGSSIGRILIKLVLLLVVLVIAIFLVEKINFPSQLNLLKIIMLQFLQIQLLIFSIFLTKEKDGLQNQNITRTLTPFLLP